MSACGNIGLASLKVFRRNMAAPAWFIAKSMTSCFTQFVAKTAEGLETIEEGCFDRTSKPEMGISLPRHGQTDWRRRTNSPSATEHCGHRVLRLGRSPSLRMTELV